MLNHLPDEILFEIFSFCFNQHKNISDLSLVCKNWQNILLRFGKLFSLWFKCSDETKANSLVQVVCSSIWSNSIISLSLNDCHLNDSHLELICKASNNGNFKNVKYFSISKNRINISTLSVIHESALSKSLQTVYFEYSNITISDIEKFMQDETHQTCLWFNSAAYFILFMQIGIYEMQNSFDLINQYFLKGAELGDAQSCYEISKRDENNLQDKLFWLRKAHEYGYCKATTELGLYHYQNSEYETAFEYFTQAAEKGNHQAMFQLGIMYENGQFVEQDYTQSKKWIYKSMNDRELAIRFLNGNCGFEKDLSRAICYFERSIHEPKSIYQMAVMYLTGNEFLEKDPLKAVNMLVGIAFYYQDASKLLAKVCLTGLEGIPRDVDGAIYYLSRDQNLSSQDLVELGKLYLEKGQEYQAEESFKKAATLEDVEAYSILAEFFKERNNYSESKRYYLLAAERGNVECQYMVGVYFGCGFGDFEMDAEKSRDYLTKAAENGHSKAQAELALILKDGGLP